MNQYKVLFITDHYIDKNIGGAKASRGFITVFSEVYEDLSLIYPDYEGSEIEKYIPSNVKGIPCLDNRSKIQKGIDIYRGRLHRYGDFVKKHLLSFHYDVIVIDHSRIWSSLASTFVNCSAKLITIHHNVEKDYVHDNPAPFYLRRPLRKYAIKAEKNAVIYSDINLTLTGKDKDDLQSMYPQAKGRFYHIGAFDYNMVNYNPSGEVNANTFIITGALSYRQSSVPIVEFINRFWPIILKMNSNSKLIIAGREPSKEIKIACIPYPSIELVSNPPEMTVYLNKAKYYICPINMGSGQKTRISDGLKSGMPILCHKASVYGYETVKDAGYIFTYDDEKTLIESLKAMLISQIDGRNVFNAYSDFFSLNASVKRLKSILVQEMLLVG